MIDTKIQCFLETTRLGSVAKAADALHFSPQTVSMQIAKLERNLRVSLFTRKGPRLALTEPGAYYFNMFLTSQNSLERVIADIKQDYANLNTMLRIGVSEWVNPYLEIADALADFKGLFPDLRVRVQVFSNRTLVEQLDAGTLDLALFSGAHLMSGKSLDVTPICHQEICLMGPQDVVGSGLTQKQREKRRELTFLIISGWDTSHLETLIAYENELRDKDIPLKNVLLLPNIDSQIITMEQGRYLAFQDRRFGYFNHIQGLGYELVDDTLPLSCAMSFKNENKNAERFVKHLKTALGA